MAIEHFSSGGQVAHEAFKLHVALREADVAGRDIGALCIRVALRDTKRLLVVGLVLVILSWAWVSHHQLVLECAV